MTLTIDQKKAVEAPGGVCVTAGAGTGKTHMLSARYLQLLRAHQFSPLEIVATTFTEMAASELRARIRKDVAQSEPPFPAEVAAELEAAPILTMHALAARICREHPEAAGVPADFTILEERPEGPIWQMEQLDEAIAALPLDILKAIRSTLLREAMEAFLKDPLTAESALACDPEDLEQVVEAERAAILQRLIGTRDWMDAVSTLRSCAGEGEREDQRLVALRAAEHLQAWQPGQPWIDLQDAVGLNLNKGKALKGWDKDQHKSVTEALKIVRNGIKDEPLLLKEHGEIDDQLAEMIPPLQQAFRLVRDFLQASKFRARTLDFADLEVHALKALEHPEVLEYYRSRWRTYLLDEVQDTNPIQAQLLDRLTTGAILTIVGDEKQSIYGFRRADVTVFQRMADSIEGRGGGRVTLQESFRTHGALISTINKICGPSLDNLRQDLEGKRPEPHPGPHVHVAHVPKMSPPNVEAQRRIEARFIARKLMAMFDEGLMIHDKPSGELRSMRWGDVAILCRTGAPLAIYEEALAAEGIPTAMARGSDLLSTREALDGTALLRFLADPRDDQALIALLRSPFFAVPDGILHRLADHRVNRTWWEILKESLEPELKHARDLLDRLLSKRHELPSRLLQLADEGTGYSAVLSAMPGNRRRLTDWRGFIAQVRIFEDGAMDVMTVIRRIRRMVTEEVEIQRPPMEAGDAIALMTIHASKGLEWPIVVVPNLSADKNSDKSQVRFDAALGVGLKFKDEENKGLEPLRFALLKSRQEAREEAEERRIYYVALTRARDHLLLTAADPAKNALSFLMPGVEAAGLTVEEIQAEAGDERPPMPVAPQAPSVPARWIERPLGTRLTELPVTALSVYAHCPRAFAYRYVDGHPGVVLLDYEERVHSDDVEELAPPLPVPVPHANRVGTAAHLALELDLDDEEVLARHFPDLAPELVAIAMGYARTFRTSPAFESVRGAIIEKERPITLKLEGLELRGMVDAVGDDFVLDFKTDRVMEPDHHAMQLWAYAQALGKPRAYLAYLHAGKLVELTVDRLAAAGMQAEAVTKAIGMGQFHETTDFGDCSGCAFDSICTHAASARVLEMAEQ